MGTRTTSWAGYAAFVWAAAYALLVRGYQGLSGTIGIAGTFEDPEAMRRASLAAGAGILLVGVGALALRPAPPLPARHRPGGCSDRRTRWRTR